MPSSLAQCWRMWCLMRTPERWTLTTSKRSKCQAQCQQTFSVITSSVTGHTLAVSPDCANLCCCCASCIIELASLFPVPLPVTSALTLRLPDLLCVCELWPNSFNRDQRGKYCCCCSNSSFLCQCLTMSAVLQCCDREHQGVLPNSLHRQCQDTLCGAPPQESHPALL